MIPLINKRLNHLIKRAVSKFSVREETILSHRKERPHPEARRFVAKGMRKFGYSYPEIGKVMGRDHTSIMYMADDDFRANKIQKNKQYSCLHYKRKI